MQSLSDDEKKEVLGEVLSDQLQAILEYVQEIPLIKQKLYEVDNRLIEVERVVKIHELDIRQIRQQFAV
jgi:hypothetical protein